METSVIDWKREVRVRVLFKVNKIFLGTDGAASWRVGQILPLRVEGSIPYSAPLNETNSYLAIEDGQSQIMSIARDRQRNFKIDLSRL